jgi:hypothetical protein
MNGLEAEEFCDRFFGHLSMMMRNIQSPQWTKGNKCEEYEKLVLSVFIAPAHHQMAHLPELEAWDVLTSCQISEVVVFQKVVELP